MFNKRTKVKPSSFILIHDAPAIPRHILVLVHGTWGVNSSWIDVGSKLVRYLLSELDSNLVNVYRFDWSGRNSTRDRDRAASDLRKHLFELGNNFPAAQVSVLAHSHGGNVLLRAIEGWDESKVVPICMATPFLKVFRRSSAAEAANILHGIAMLIVATILLFAFFEWQPVAQFHFILFLLLLPANKIIDYGLKWLTNAVDARGSKLEHEVNYRINPNLRLLVIRIVGDEASLFLNTYVFLDLLCERSLVLIENVKAFLSSPSREHKKLIGILSAIYVGSILFAAALSSILNSDLLGLGFIVLFSPIEIALIVILASLVVFPLLFVSMSLAVAPLGWNAIAGVLTAKVSVETTPTGSWTVHLLNPMGETSELLHSQVYNDPRSLLLIRLWIKAS